jgi:hypothetical protein
MSAATSANSVRRIFSLKDIIRTIPAHHPHVLGAGFLKRTLERQRIVQAIRAEEHRMSFCLVVQTDSNGSPGCGVLTAVPKPYAEETFAKCGPAPMLFGFLFGFRSYSQFEAVFEEVKRIGVENERHGILGPFEATINYSCGLLEAPPAFPLGLLMPDNPIEWNDYFERFGFTVAERLFTFEIELARANFRRMRTSVAADLKLSVSQLTPPFSAEQRAAIAEVFNSGWRNNWGFVPIDVGFIETLEREFSPILWPGLSFIAYQERRPVGILIAAPDINEITRSEPTQRRFSVVAGAWRFFWRRHVRALRIFILGLAPEFHGSREGAGIIELMLDTGKDSAERYAATHVQLGWTLSSNSRVNRLVELWAPTAQRVVHRIWQFQLPDAANRSWRPEEAVNNRQGNAA